jgi:hypothetical protein
MAWFSFLSSFTIGGEPGEIGPSGTAEVEKYPPVRRKISFPILNENLKISDWIYVSLFDIKIGRFFIYSNGAISSNADPYSYLVVYENGEVYQPTYSYIDDNNNLYFKSVTSVDSGSQLVGSYYVYYHHKNIQRIEQNEEGIYIQSEEEIDGFRAFEDGSLSLQSTIDKYSNTVLNQDINERVSSFSYISSTGLWVNQESDSPGNKALGKFDGPKLRIFGNKSPESGKVSIKIIKTSSTDTGQSIIKKDIIDLYNPTLEQDFIIYETDVSEYIGSTEINDLYGSFIFEIEILDDKNISSSGKKIKITKYSFSKNYFLSIGKQELYENIIFTTSGVIR